MEVDIKVVENNTYLMNGMITLSFRDVL